MIQRIETFIGYLTRALCFGSLFLISYSALVGCSENYGRLQRSREIDRIFKTYRVLPEYKYYFSGPEGRPDAIIGILRQYTLQTTQWTQVSLTDAELKKIIDWMNFHHSNRVRYYPYGFVILDPKGKRLGIWYSIWDWTTISVEEDNLIRVFPPAKKDRFGNGDDREKMKFD